MATKTLNFEFGIPAGATGATGQSAYDTWVAYAESQDPPLAQGTGSIQDMFDWLASQATVDIQASATVTALPTGSTPTVDITVT